MKKVKRAEGGAKVKKIEDDNRVLTKVQRFFCYIVLVLISFLCVFSFYVLIINTTRSHADIQKGFTLLPGKSFLFNMKNLLNNKQLPVLKGTYNSLFIATLSAGFATYFSSMTAFAIHAYDFKFKKYAFAFIMMIMMIPSQVTALGFVKMVGDVGLLNSFIPLTVPAIASPIVFFFMKQYMTSVLPIELIEAARIDGAREFRIFNQIVLPIMKPAMAVQIIFTFVGSWNNYFIPSLLLNKSDKKTLPILIAQLRSADFLKFDMGQVYMLIAMAILPVVIVYLFLSKYIVGGVTLGSVKG